ncbi:acyl-CoA N-acyltransferase [Mycena galericulata]|nr:acyl-CoA N-acyltransferase [Mycena galericulata]
MGYTEVVNASFCFPIPQELENDHVTLVPFNSSHAEAFRASASDALFTYFSSVGTASEFIANIETWRTKNMALFAVVDRKSAELAGIVDLHYASTANLSAELGIVTLPRFQRTHVTSNAAGLLLHWALDTPAAGGLGLRRVAWTTNALNVHSIRAAERMGFRKEALLRWDRVLAEGKIEDGNGAKIREGDPNPNCLSRDSVLLGLCWDDWEDGVRDAVDAIMHRSD